MRISYTKRLISEQFVRLLKWVLLMVFEQGRKSCAAALGATEVGFAEMELHCVFCGAPARLEGR
jgi:hypothetical protein